MAAPSRPLESSPDLTLPPDRYERVTAALHRLSGIRLRPGKRALVVARLGPRVRASGQASLRDYVDALVGGSMPEEVDHFVDVLTTNKSGFYREPAHFEYLTREVFPVLARQERPIRIWSAGCATGEEPYTMAMVARDGLPEAALRRTRILATDISHRALTAARAGRYTAAQCAEVGAPELARHFERPGGDDQARSVAPAVRDLVRFAWLNLVDQWPMRGPFDVILCRNVMIYFDRETQQRLVNRLEDLLVPGGVLCVGHAESLSGVAHDLGAVQPAIYRRAGESR